MKLTELEPQFLKRIDDKHFRDVDTLAEADGIVFLCPKCFAGNGNRRPGVHSVICWRPHVPQSTPPTPGRWEFQGAGYHDLSLVAGSSSILLKGGCEWHGFITNGEIK